MSDTNESHLSERWNEIVLSQPNVTQGHIGLISADQAATKYNINVQVQWDEVNLTKKARDGYRSLHHVYWDKKSKEATVIQDEFPMPFDPAQIPLESYSPNRTYLARFKKALKEEEEDEFLIYSLKRLKARIPTYKKLHGAIYTGPREGGIAWSHDETRFAFIAELKMPDTQSFWENPNKDPPKDPQVVGAQYEYSDDWGEQYVGKKTGVIFIVQISSGKIEQVEGIPEHLTCSEIQWTPNDQGLVFTGTPTNQPRRLGILHCYNRQSRLYHLKLEEQARAEMLPTECASVRSPRFSPDGRKLAYLGTREVVTHNTCSKLCCLDWESQTEQVLVDIVDEPAQDYTAKAATAFNGIYCSLLLKNCWSHDSKYLYFDAQVGSRVLWKYVDVAKKQVISPIYYEQEELACEQLLDIRENMLLLLTSSPSKGPSVYLSELCDGKYTQIINVTKQDKSTFINQWDVLPIPCSDPVEVKLSDLARQAPVFPEIQDSNNYEAILLIPSVECPENGWPVVVDIHGGPNGVTPASYRPMYDYLCSLGYAVITVNYRGSVGFGINPLESLIGKAGTQDIVDVQHAVEHIFKTTPHKLDRSRVHCSGGSHGGFIVCHLITQYPSFYRSCVTRNPVTNISGTFYTSDIPEWGNGVTGIKYMDSISACPSAGKDSGDPTTRLASIARMWEMSPMAQDPSKVTTPTLFGLGGKDRRVPASQGLQFHDSLKAHGVNTKILWYPEDSHPLSSVAAFGDFSVHWASWINAHN